MKEIFESKVKENLLSLGVNETSRIGAAVSGGADSLSLLISLCHIYKKVFVINVNHNIREETETCADSDFVRKKCEELCRQGFEVIFECVELPRGKVFEAASEREGGVEEAARFLRYKVFEDFVKRNKIDFLCLAHNQNDQFETLLMRFLQGGGTDNTGITEKRKFADASILRPLLNVERSEIEAYLNELGEKWRTDSTNADSSYLRNNIRLNLVPLLDKNFSGWKKALLTGREKNIFDKEIIQKSVDDIKIQREDDGVFIKKEDFESLSEGLKIRILIKMCNAVSFEDESFRIPFGFLKDILNNKNFERKVYKNIEISAKNGRLSVKKYAKKQTDFTFSAIIEDERKYDFHFGTLKIEKSEIILNGKSTGVFITLPVLVRSCIVGDEVLTAGGGLKKVSDVFSDWKVPENKRTQIPLVQELNSKDQKISCIFGEVLGFDNWIVK